MQQTIKMAPEAYNSNAIQTDEANVKFSLVLICPNKSGYSYTQESTAKST
jgi:hypothetical protein